MGGDVSRVVNALNAVSDEQRLQNLRLLLQDTKASIYMSLEGLTLT